MILCSVLIPTRARPARLVETMHSILDTMRDPARVEFCLRIDDDDLVTHYSMDGILAAHTNIGFRIAPRVGYDHMGAMAQDCVNLAQGRWCWLVDDDATVEGTGFWDEQLAAISPEHNVAQCEFYHLCQSKYPSGSCGPVGMIVPRNSWVGHADLATAGVADDFFRDTLVGKLGFHVNLLKGMTYRHQRDGDHELREHRKL